MMQIKKIHSFLTKPTKALEVQPPILGTEVDIKSNVYTLLSEVFNKSIFECNIDISFNSLNGEQKNSSRDLIIQYAEYPTIENGRKIAEVLQSVTTRRSGMGLLFLVVAKNGPRTRVLVSRFPADAGLLADELETKLSVTFVEKVFMKNVTAYKSALFEDISFKRGFWDGKATDKQINSSDISISDYWIRQFLQSDFRTTPEAGTRRLALTFRNVAKKATELNVKSELAAAAQLINSMDGKKISIKEICEKYGFSPLTIHEIVKELKHESLMKERFTFSKFEFQKHVQFRMVELDNGGQLLAEVEQFDSIFIVTTENEEGSVSIRTVGKIINDLLRKTK